MTDPTRLERDRTALAEARRRAAEDIERIVASAKAKEASRTANQEVRF